MATEFLKISSPRLSRVFEEVEREPLFEKNEKKLSLMKKFKKSRESSIQFMVKLCAKYKFKKDTLFLAIKIMDSLVEEKIELITHDPQLLAGTLIVLATKYNEVYPVTIDQINLVTEKYYPREQIFDIEGRILECLDFEIPEYTVFSLLLNELEPTFGKKPNSDSDKENDCNANNLKQDNELKNYKQDEHALISKTLKAMKQPECFKYGEQILFHALHSYLQNHKIQGMSVSVVKVNYIKTVLKKVFEAEKQHDKKEVPKILVGRSPQHKITKLNPEQKTVKTSKFFIF